MVHGGDLLSYKDFFEGELVDYSSNINPLGYPQGLEEVLSGAFPSLLTYPDINYRELRASVSSYLGCEEGQVILGNGSVELIDGFIKLFDRVVLHTPSFYEYEARARVHKKELVYLSYDENFRIDLEELDLLRRGDLLILGNPNNPTGLRIEETKLRAIYNLVLKKEAFLLLDEAFFEFSRDYDSIKVLGFMDFQGLAILRASTKFFGLPGLRLGYGSTGRAMVKKLNELLLPWNINSLAEAAGGVIFLDRAYIERSRAYVEIERAYLSRGISSLASFEALESHTNFLLIKLLACDEKLAFDYFLKRGFLLRKCSSFRGLEGNYLRIAVKDRDNNKRLLAVFRSLDDYLRKIPASL